MRGGAKCGHGFTTKMRRCTAMNVLKTERKTLSLQAVVRLKHHPWFDIVKLKIIKTQPIFIFLIYKMAHLQPKWLIPLNDHGAIVP